MKRNLFSLLGFTFLFLSFAYASAADYSGNCGANGSNCRWEITGSKLTISGTGAMADYSSLELSERPPYWNYAFSVPVTELEVKNGVTHIGSFAFSLLQIKKVTLPNSVLSFGKSAFYFTSLEGSFSIPDKLQADGIGDLALCKLPSITAFTTSSSCLNFRNYLNSLYSKDTTELFLYPQGRTEKSISIWKSCKVIHKYAFYENSSLTEIRLPQNLQTIEKDAFLDCKSITDIYATMPYPITVDEAALPANYKSIKLHVPVNKVGYYKAADVWKDMIIVGDQAEDLSGYTLHDVYIGDYQIYTDKDENVYAPKHIVAGRATYSPTWGILTLYGADIRGGVRGPVFVAYNGKCSIITYDDEHALYLKKSTYLMTGGLVGYCNSSLSITSKNSTTTKSALFVEADIQMNTMECSEESTSIKIVSESSNSPAIDASQEATVTVDQKVETLMLFALNYGEYVSENITISAPSHKNLSTTSGNILYYHTNTPLVFLGNIITTRHLPLDFAYKTYTGVTGTGQIDYDATKDQLILKDLDIDVTMTAEQYKKEQAVLISTAKSVLVSGESKIKVNQSEDGHAVSGIKFYMNDVEYSGSPLSIDASNHALMISYCAATFNNTQLTLKSELGSAIRLSDQSSTIIKSSDFTLENQNSTFSTISSSDKTNSSSVVLLDSEYTSPESAKFKDGDLYDKNDNIVSGEVIIKKKTAKPSDDDDPIVYLVKFVDWDGKVLKKELVEEGDNATPPDDPTREGYKFVGWDKSYKRIKEDMVITAMYEQLEDGLEDVALPSQLGARKIIIDGVMYIFKNGNLYTLLGNKVM